MTSQVTYYDLWKKDKAELKQLAEDAHLEKNLRAIAYIRLYKPLLAQRLMSEIEEKTVEDMDVNLYLKASMPNSKLDSLVPKANQILQINPNMILTNLALAEYFRRRKQGKEVVAHSVNILEILPLHEKAFLLALTVLHQGKVSPDNRQALGLINNFRASALNSPISIIKKIYHVITAILCEVIIRSRSLSGVLIFIGLILFSAFAPIPILPYLSIFAICISVALFSLFSKNGLAFFISTWLLGTIVLIWAGGFLIRWMTTL